MVRRLLQLYVGLGLYGLSTVPIWVSIPGMFFTLGWGYSWG